MMMGIADTLMLSAISDNAVSGVGAANQYLHISILLMEVVGNGASIVVAQYIGARKMQDASRIAALAITLNLGLGLVISSLFLIFSGTLLEGLNLRGEVLTYAESYLAIVGGFIFLQALINSLSAIIRVHGYTKEAMYVSLGMNLFHVAANYALIFGKFGFPVMGVEGAAISSVVSRLLALIVFFWLLYRIMEVRIKIQDYFSISKEYVGKILQIGIPSALEQILYQGCQIIFLYYVTYLGEASMAARQYANNISMFIYLFAVAIGMGTAIIVGRLIGARRVEEAYKRVWKSSKVAFFATMVMISVVILFREPLVGIFTDDPEIMRIASQVLILSLVLETGRTMNIVLINSLRASGDARFPVWMGMLSMVMMSLPLGYFLVFELNMGLAGVWLAIAADEWARGIIMYFRWRSRAWEKHALIQPDIVEDTVTAVT